MDTDKSAQEASQWKKKYFDQLEQSEHQEKQWSEADELLRKTVSRLTLAADGVDDTLDRQLRDLRNAIRDRASTAQLRSLLDDMSRTLVRLDKTRQQRGRQLEEKPLLNLLEALPLPDSSREVKALKKQLAAADGGDNKAVIKTFAALLCNTMQQTPDETSNEKESGLLSRLFKSAEKKPPQKKIRKQAADETAGQAPAAADDDSAAPQETLLPDHETFDTVREILIRLLERLSLPAELRDKVDAIREDIETISAGDSWDAVVEKIADLIQAIRAQTQKEKQGISNFLQQLSERLQEVDQQLQGSEQFYDETSSANERLDHALKEEITGIQAGANDAGDLETFKRLVQAHVDTVLEHMQKHRSSEQQRYEQAKQEISSMGERLNDLEQEAETLRTRLSEERNQAMTDALTGIPNRLAYEERLQQEIARWKRFATPLVLVVWDIDLFKRINDSFGHKAGDKVLRNVAQVLARGIRETDFVARYGGEEFVQLMTGSSLADCLPVAEKLRAAVEAAGFHFREEAVTVTISCGLAEFGDGDGADQCFERADKALYKAKQRGRNRCEVADS